MKFRIKKASTRIKHCVCAAAITIVLIQTAPVLAQADTTSQSSATSQTEQTYPFNIPAKPLPQAIADLSAVTGLQVLYTEQSTFNHTAPALKGDYSVREALRRLLDGSGLTVRFTGSNSVTIELAPSESGAMTLPLMTVTADAVPGELPPAYAGGQIARGGHVSATRAGHGLHGARRGAEGAERPAERHGGIRGGRYRRNVQPRHQAGR